MLCDAVLVPLISYLDITQRWKLLLLGPLVSNQLYKPWNTVEMCLKCVLHLLLMSKKHASALSHFQLGPGKKWFVVLVREKTVE